MKMPFGKYRGVEVSDLPGGYLRWLADLDDLRDPLRSAVKAERNRRAGRRDDDFSQPPEFCFNGAERQTARRIIEAGRRALARVEHPDAGGDMVAMTNTNAVADMMLETLR